MKKILSTLLIVACLLCSSGCASMLCLAITKEEMRTSAIQARQLSDGGVGVGVDISNIQALRYRPGRQVTAAVVDAASMYGAYELFNYLSDQQNGGDSDGDVTITSGRDTYIITGNENSTETTGDEQAGE